MQASRLSARSRLSLPVTEGVQLVFLIGKKRKPLRFPRLQAGEMNLAAFLSG